MPEFRMPSLGADMTAGTLLEWLVHEGDPVHRGDVVAVVDTDKAAIEVECFEDGVVDRLLVQPGQKVPVGAALASIRAGEGAVAALETGPAPLETAAAPLEAPAPAGPLVTSPLVRRLAAERGLDLAAVPATGTGGVVHRRDLPQAPAPRTGRVAHRRESVRASPLARRLAAAGGLDLAEIGRGAKDGTVHAADVRRALAGHPAAAEPTRAAAPTRPARTAPAARGEAMRRAIGELMERSNREIPHYYLTQSVDLAAAMAWLHQRNRELPVTQRLLPAALLLAATAQAAAQVPQLNGHWRDGGFAPSSTVELGTVVSLRGGGILVPVVHDAANRSVVELMAAARDLAERARAGRLRSSDLRPASLTVSNLGEQGVDSVLGVIQPPQVAMVGFGAVQERPWAVDGLLGVRPVVVVSLAADHRASDGAVGARLLHRIDRLLQRPEEL